MSDTFEYKKVSQLPTASSVSATDVIVMNINGKTSKVAVSALVDFVKTQVSTSALEGKVTELTNNVATLSSSVTANTETINNIITAGFNIIGVDV